MPDKIDVIAFPHELPAPPAHGGAEQARREVAVTACPAISFNDVYREYGQRVIGILRRLRVPESDLEDVFQDVFLAIHAKLPTYEGRARLSTWVYRFCLNKASDYHRKHGRRRRFQDPCADVPPECAAPGNPEQQLLAQRGLRSLQEALDSLPEDQVYAFLMYEVEQLSVKEVASLQSCPLFTVYGRLRTARQKILAMFGQAERDPEES